MVCVEAAEGSDFDGDDGFDNLCDDFLPRFERGVVSFGENGVIDHLEIVGCGFGRSGRGGGYR